MALLPNPLKRDHAKYTLPSQVPPVRSTSMAVLSWKTPSRFGAEDPRATITDRRKRSPSLLVSPDGPSGLSNVATQTSPKVFAVPAGSPELSDPMKTRPWLSQAITGSPDDAVRIRARSAYGDGSPG